MSLNLHTLYMLHTTNVEFSTRVHHIMFDDAHSNACIQKVYSIRLDMSEFASVIVLLEFAHTLSIRVIPVDPVMKWYISSSYVYSSIMWCILGVSSFHIYTYIHVHIHIHILIICTYTYLSTLKTAHHLVRLTRSHNFLQHTWMLCTPPQAIWSVCIMYLYDTRYILRIHIRIHSPTYTITETWEKSYCVSYRYMIYTFTETWENIYRVSYIYYISSMYIYNTRYIFSHVSVNVYIMYLYDTRYVFSHVSVNVYVGYQNDMYVYICIYILICMQYDT